MSLSALQIYYSLLICKIVFKVEIHYIELNFISPGSSKVMLFS